MHPAGSDSKHHQSRQARILFLDAYDSFSNNIVSLLADVLSAKVDILPIDADLPVLSASQPRLDNNGDDSNDDDKRQALRRLVAHYDAVVCGPGPGAPDCDQDVGLMKHIWDLDDDSVLPVLGICLGFQSLIVHCGGVVRRLSTGLHGMIRPIEHVDNQLALAEGNIFSGVPEFKATLYHSLFADIGQASGGDDAWQTTKWESPVHLPDIVPLAWVTERRSAEFDESILMGVKHRTKPFWGLQYHPESVCTESTGHQVIRNWFAEAVRWNQARGRTATETVDEALEGMTCNLPKVFEGLRKAFSHGRAASPGLQGVSVTPKVVSKASLWDSDLDHTYFSRTLQLPDHVEIPDIVESLQEGRRDFVVLDSASAKTSRTSLDVKGRYSIIALDIDEALQLEYRTGTKRLTLRRKTSDNNASNETEVIDFDEAYSIWNVLASFWSRREQPLPEDMDATYPFLGGFMGFTTYELGLEGIDVAAQSHDRHNRPDLGFAWVTRSAVVDHLEGTICLQTLSCENANTWLDATAQTLFTSSVWTDGLGADFSRTSDSGVHDRTLLRGTSPRAVQPTPPLTPDDKRSTRTNIQIPVAEEYEGKVRSCQDYIAAGDSYELCLTDQTLITRPKSPSLGLIPVNRKQHRQGIRTHTPKEDVPSANNSDALASSWSLYRTLRTRNPAPFGSYIRLSGATLVSSSPERFLKVSGDTGRCSMRPMKGTVKKSSAVSTLAQAEEILHVPKEEAENLMIVDLVRHDLHSVCGVGAEAVQVPQLLKVEEYASVFQMISVVEGQLPGHGDHTPKLEQPRPNGLDVLAATLPPGSMTGAPKKRSCEILQTLEGRSAERSLYSGVVGYMDVRGNSDWSVTIRSLFRWDDDEVLPSIDKDGDNGEDQQALELWRIGAGGAVTALSTAQGEREEMFTKLKGPLGIFEEHV